MVFFTNSNTRQSSFAELILSPQTPSSSFSFQKNKNMSENWTPMQYQQAEAEADEAGKDILTITPIEGKTSQKDIQGLETPFTPINWMHKHKYGQGQWNGDETTQSVLKAMQTPIMSPILATSMEKTHICDGDGTLPTTDDRRVHFKLPEGDDNKKNNAPLKEIQTDYSEQRNHADEGTNDTLASIALLPDEESFSSIDTEMLGIHRKRTDPLSATTQIHQTNRCRNLSQATVEKTEIGTRRQLHFEQVDCDPKESTNESHTVSYGKGSLSNFMNISFPAVASMLSDMNTTSFGDSAATHKYTPSVPKNKPPHLSNASTISQTSPVSSNSSERLERLERLMLHLQGMMDTSFPNPVPQQFHAASSSFLSVVSPSITQGYKSDRLLIHRQTPSPAYHSRIISPVIVREVPVSQLQTPQPSPHVIVIQLPQSCSNHCTSGIRAMDQQKTPVLQGTKSVASASLSTPSTTAAFTAPSLQYTHTPLTPSSGDNEMQSQSVSCGLHQSCQGFIQPVDFTSDSQHNMSCKGGYNNKHRQLSSSIHACQSTANSNARASSFRQSVGGSPTEYATPMVPQHSSQPALSTYDLMSTFQQLHERKQRLDADFASFGARFLSVSGNYDSSNTPFHSC